MKQKIEQRVSSQSFNKSEILFLFDILKALSKVEDNAIVDNFHQTVRSLLCWNICRKMVGRENKEEAVSEFEYYIVKRVLFIDSNYEMEAKKVVLQVMLMVKAKTLGDQSVQS